MTTNEKIQNAYLSPERERQIQALTKLQTSGTLDHVQINLMLQPTAYALRDMKLADGNLTLGATASLLGTYVSSLFWFLQAFGVISDSDATEDLPASKYIDLGYFVIIPEQFRGGRNHRCPEFLVTPLGRRWLHHNATLGWMDHILTTQAFWARVPRETGLPVPLPDHGPKLS